MADEQPGRPVRVIFIERLARLTDPSPATILSEALAAVEERVNGAHHVQ